MALSNKPAITTLQVGGFAWFIYNNTPVKAKIIKTLSDVSNPNNDSTGVQSNYYYLEGYTEQFSGTKLYTSKELLVAAVTEATPS